MLMPVKRGQPTLQDVHIDQALTQISVAQIQDQSKFLFNKIAPIIPVDKQSDKYWVFPKNEWLIDEARKRGDSEESAGGGYVLSQDSYFADVWAYHKDLGSQVKANADAGLQLERGTTQFVTSKLLLRAELQFINDFFKTGVWGTDRAGVAAGPTGTQFIQWDQFTTSDPVTDIEQSKDYIESVTGFEANTMVIGKAVWMKLKRHPVLRDQIKYTSPNNVTIDLLKQLFEIENIYIGRSIRATNNRGGTPAYAYNYGKICWIGYVNPSPAPFTPSAMYSFGWTGVSGGLNVPIAIDSFDIRRLKTTRYEGEFAVDNKIVSADMGVYMSAVVA